MQPWPNSAAGHLTFHQGVEPWFKPGGNARGGRPVTVRLRGWK